MTNSIWLGILAICSYLFGNINWALLISKYKKSDIRKMGSGNPGTLNMSRNFGLKTGLLTFFLDVLKGAVPTLIAFFVFKDKTMDKSLFVLTDLSMYLCGLFVVLGHIYPVVLKFKGGKGIASTIGVLLVCEFTNGFVWGLVFFMALVCAVIFIYITEFGAMGSFIAITPSAIMGGIRLFLRYSNIKDLRTTILYVISSMLILLLCFFTWFAHRKNIHRMLSGDEHPTSIKQMLIKAKLKKQEEKNK